MSPDKRKKVLKLHVKILLLNLIKTPDFKYTQN